MRHIAVIDIGKTNAKLALVDLQARREIAVTTRPNRVIEGAPYRHFDTEGHWQFLLAALRDVHAAHGVDAISVTTHGAAAALIGADGRVAAPVMDYEDTGPDGLRAAYDALRPGFDRTGSPGLPMGLNLGAQFYFQFSRDPELLARTAAIVTYPQYWGFRLTGELACDATSLGCHTDLWEPEGARFSSLVEALGLGAKMAPVRASAEVLGHVTAEVAGLTGLPRATPVAVGIHDSNASLLPHLVDRTGAFAVVSTGTWVVSMALGGARVALDATRDTLINVNARGEPTPSARFMGGREYELTRRGAEPTAQDERAVLQAGVMLMPAVQRGSGPFPQAASHWAPAPPDSDAMADVALGHYLALMTAECLGMIGAEGPVVVEGPFGQNPWFTAMLAAATGRGVECSASQTGTAIGAALLFDVAQAGRKAAADPATQRDGAKPVDRMRAEHAALWRARLRG